jgi:hypothetical protein
LEGFAPRAEEESVNQRDDVRYSSGVLPEAFCKVVVSWDDSFPVEAHVVDCSAKGLKISLVSGQEYETKAPRKGDGIKVRMPMDGRWITGRCASVVEKNRSLSIAMWFENPDEQAWFRDRFYRSLNNNHNPGPFVSHEWEELIFNLCNSEDPELQQIGLRYKTN